MPKMIVILAGGLATRLYPLTKQVPKAMIDISGKPFIVRQLELLRSHGFADFLICAGYLGDVIQKFLGNGKIMGVNIRYSFDGEKLLGTGGALRKALPLLNDTFFVLYGDSYLITDYHLINCYYEKNNKKALMTVFKNMNHWDKSNVMYQDGLVIRYDKRNPSSEMIYIDYGLSILTKDIVSQIPEEVCDLESIYQRLAEEKELLGFEIKSRFYEIGSMIGLQELRKIFMERVKK